MLKSTVMTLARKTGILRRLNWHLRRLNYRRRVDVNGVPIRIPTILGISSEVTEVWMIELLVKLLRQRRGAFVDVGVNVGQTLIKVKALDSQRRYIGFEPNPVCVFYVKELIRENAFQGCTVFPIGLYTQDAVLSLDLFSETPTDSSASVVSGYRPTARVASKMFVPVFRFDTIADLLDVDSVALLKIDVEGAELEVVTSLASLIRAHRPTVLLEVLPAYSDDNVSRKARQTQLERIFADAHYAVFRVAKTPDDRYAGLRRVDGFGIHSDLSQCDYVMVPNEHREGLSDVLP